MVKASVIALVCCLFLSGAAVRAETVALTTGQDDPPFTDRTRADGGTATKLVLSVFHMMGYQTKLDWLPWRRGYSLTKSGVYQASFPYLKTPDREHDFIYSDVLFSDVSYLWTRAGEMLSIDDPAEFRKKTICVPQGYHSPLLVTLSAQIDRGEVRIERPDTPERCVQMLAAGRVDALSGQEAEIAVPIEANHLTGAIIHDPAPLMKLDFYVIFNKDNPGLARHFNETLRLIRPDPR